MKKEIQTVYLFLNNNRKKFRQYLENYGNIRLLILDSKKKVNVTLKKLTIDIKF